MTDNQDIVRDRLNSYIENKGVRSNFIANKVGILPSLLCNFRKNKKVLWQETLDGIDKFLEENYK